MAVSFRVCLPSALPSLLPRFLLRDDETFSILSLTALLQYAANISDMHGLPRWSLVDHVVIEFDERSKMRNQQLKNV